jgi:hypothetical protein
MAYITRIVVTVACVGFCVTVLGWSSAHLLRAQIPSGLHYSNAPAGITIFPDQEGDEEDGL